MSKSNTKYTSQHIDNQSFDETLQMRVTELIGADGVLKNPATEEKQDALIGNYALKLDDTTTANVTYVGKAVPGSSGASAVWQVKRIDESSGMVITWADGNALFDNSWDNRVSLTYL